MEKADLLSRNLVSEAKNNSSTFALPVAFMLAHVVRAETIGFAIWKQLDDIIRTFGKYGLRKYDIEQICSIQNTVRKFNRRTKQYELISDVKAIRDSIAHGHFSINRMKDTYEIEFANNEYPFKKTFTKKEFEKFFDLHTLLYKFQINLLIIIQVLPILTTHLLKKAPAS